MRPQIGPAQNGNCQIKVFVYMMCHLLAFIAVCIQ